MTTIFSPLSRSAGLLSGLLVWVGLAGCGSLRNEVSPDQLGLASAKLVIHGFLSPQDTTLAIKVSQSRTVTGDSLSSALTDGNITDAVVTLTDGSRSVRLRYKANGATYYSAPATQLPILPGHTYQLTVVTADGQQARSQCTIPAPVRLSAVVIDSLTETQGRGQVRRYFARARWQDPAGPGNYYQVAGAFQVVTGTSATTGKNTVVYNNLGFDDDNRGLSADTDADGGSLVSGRAFLGNIPLDGATPKGFRQQYRGSRLRVELYSVEASYYQYRSAVIRQGRVRNNPFAEPVLIPSNIGGGLGCFAGYNQSAIETVVN